MLGGVGEGLSYSMDSKPWESFRHYLLTKLKILVVTSVNGLLLDEDAIGKGENTQRRWVSGMPTP
jgi:hypothetical protein